MTLPAVDRDRQLRRLVRLAEQRHFIDGQRCRDLSRIVDRFHCQRPDRLGDRGADAFAQAVLGIFVHQEADRAAVHAVDALAGVHGVAQRLQHEPVAAKRDDHRGLGDVGLAIERGQPRSGLPRAGCLRRDECDDVGSGYGHARQAPRCLASMTLGRWIAILSTARAVGRQAKDVHDTAGVQRLACAKGAQPLSMIPPCAKVRPRTQDEGGMHVGRRQGGDRHRRGAGDRA
jgi:hypothetical protein